MTTILKPHFQQTQELDLAPYAMRSSESRGRRYPVQPDRYRDEFQRDRDRIIHCVAFRKLEYKTQVFVYNEHDHFRTRLTHTLEVAEIARRLAVALNVNERLAESIALAHDLCRRLAELRKSGARPGRPGG
ncbi:HD domain-containing protein [Candidatus Sumerlaeota bacterium]|nr:HD domain-containing protein [Candidatus Sumerlaeota bacterium]